MSSASPANAPEDSQSPGFKSFWRKSDKNSEKKNISSQNDVVFVQQDPSSNRGGNRISRLLKRGSKYKTPEDGEGTEGKTEAQKRRQQVYQAQKRHRNRKAEYVKSLEEEVARLQNLDSKVNSEKNALAFQNQQMRELLASNSLDYQLETMNLAPVPATNSAEDVSMAGVDIRWDEAIGHDRTFIDWSENDSMAWTTTDSNSQTQSVATPPQPRMPVKGDSWAAVDFILALEWVCQDHIHHYGINPEAKVPTACQQSGITGHGLTTTACVYDRALPVASTDEGSSSTLQVPRQQGAQEQGAKSKWQLPHAEIDKLVQMSEQLPIDDESITPAQAYSAIKDAVPSEDQLRPTLEAMKPSLAEMVQCQGFGAVMPAENFWKELDKWIEQLKED